MGGNVFAEKTSSIKREHIEPTLNKYFAELKFIFPNKTDIFNTEHFHTLGSVGKKPVSGDIDLGIDICHVIDYNDIHGSVEKWSIAASDFDNEFNQLKKRARSSTDDQLQLKALLKLICQQINDFTNSITCDEEKVNVGTMFTMFPQYRDSGIILQDNVQIDWMVGDIDWLRFSYYSAAYPDDSNVKGLHRTQLMVAAFQLADLSFSHAIGVKDKTTKELVATTPDQSLAILSERLGFEITRDSAEDFYALHKLLRTNLSDDKYGTLMYIYFKILDSTRTDIPDELQKYWIKRREKFGLTGKFLPETSKLKEYV